MSKSIAIPTFLERKRIFIFYGLMILVFGYFAVRLFRLQIVDYAKYLGLADENRTTEISVQTERGIIYDRNGYVLARNVASYNVVLVPAEMATYPEDAYKSYHLVDKEYTLTNPDWIKIGEVQKMYSELSQLLDVPVTAGDMEDENQVRVFKECNNKFGIAEIAYIGETNHPYEGIKIKCNIDRQTALTIQEKAADWPGVKIEVEPIREYPTGWLTSEIIGFLGPVPALQQAYYEAKGFVTGRDKVGYAGVESSLQDILGGTNGKRVVEVDVAGAEIRDLQPEAAPIPGYNVKLTIDTRLQAAAKQALTGELNFWNTYLNDKRMVSGVVIAMNPKTGEILAMVSEPTYENNRMAREIPGDYYTQLSNDSLRPLFNMAVSGEYPPGSVFKMAAAVGILNEGVVTPEQQIEDPGKITVMQKYSPNDPGTPYDYVCWEKTGHGMVDYLHGIAWSCDVYWYKVGGGYENEVPGNGLGIWRMGEYARALGYDKKSGVELPGEETGLIPDPDWKRVTQGENWATGDTYIATMGQGYVLATPLQVLESAATIANDGKLMQPTLVEEVLDADGNVIRPFTPKLVWDLTKDARIHVYDDKNLQTGEMKTVQPWVLQLAKKGMNYVTLANENGTAKAVFEGAKYSAGGKTGTAEYCDDKAQAKNLCKRGSWPTHSWYMGFAPYEDPEIAVVAFVYNGGEGASVSAPIVRTVMDAYFCLKSNSSNCDSQ